MSAFRACLAAAGRAGVALAVETHGAITANLDGAATHRHTVTTDAALARLLRELPPAAGINHDPGNLRAAQTDDTRYALDLVYGRVNYCHLKDWKRTGAGWVAYAPGDDVLDYAELLPRMGIAGCT